MPANRDTDIACKTALVTGSTGYVGSHLVQRLVKDGWNVHAIVRPKSIAPAVASIDSVVIHRHDGSTENLIAIVAAARPHTVFHLASLFLAQHQPKDIEPLIRSNVLSGAQLLEAMKESGVNHLVNTGTSWQHFENKHYSPVCLYAATKQAFETIIQYYVETSSFKVITLKLFDTYGPNDRRAKLFTLLRSVASEKKSIAMSPGEQLIDLVYIDDVVDAFVLAASRLETQKESTAEEYSVSSGTPLSLRELVATYARVTGKTLDVTWGGRPYRPREVMVPWTKGALLPGWQPRTRLEDGIRLMETAC